MPNFLAKCCSKKLGHDNYQNILYEIILEEEVTETANEHPEDEENDNHNIGEAIENQRLILEENNQVEDVHD